MEVGEKLVNVLLIKAHLHIRVQDECKLCHFKLCHSFRKVLCCVSAKSTRMLPQCMHTGLYTAPRQDGSLDGAKHTTNRLASSLPNSTSSNDDPFGQFTVVSSVSGTRQFACYL